MNYFIGSLLEIPNSGQELQLKFNWKIFVLFFEKVQRVQNQTRGRKTVHAHRAVLRELIWSLVDSSSRKLVNKYPYSLGSGSVST